MRTLAVLAITVAVSGAASVAKAADGESALSISANFASLTVDQGTNARPNEKSGIGGLLGVDYQRGFGDSFWLRGGLGFGLCSVDGRASYTTVGTVGLTYAVDILKYVPYIGVGVGGVLVGAGALQTHIDPVIDLAVGLEIQQSPAFSFSFEARFDSLWAKTTFFYVGPRVSFKWGYF